MDLIFYLQNAGPLASWKVSILEGKETDTVRTSHPGDQVTCATGHLGLLGQNKSPL